MPWAERSLPRRMNRGRQMDSANTIGQLPTEHSRRFQARALAAMFGAGAALGLVAVIVPHGPGVNALAWALNSPLGLPTAGALVLRGARTPAWIRHTLITEFQHHISRAQRHGSPLCVAIIDVDGLKALNDRGGHHAGDQALADCARAWRAALRDHDVLVRHGGDEFVALLPDCPPDAAGAVIDRLRAAGPVGCSAGLAWWTPGDTAADVLARADTELHNAKRAIA